MQKNKHISTYYNHNFPCLSSEDDAQAIKPLIKWAGGKRFLTKTISKIIGPIKQQYFEPFFGGGAVFFGLRPKQAFLSDMNEQLINAYIQIRDFPDQLIDALNKKKNSEDEYYRIRESRPRTPINCAARFLYLTRLSFNGIYRVNLSGNFNVPYGKKTHLTVVDTVQLRRVSQALQGITLQSGDFEALTQAAAPGDVIYFDPPYTVAHANNGFVKYNEKIFSWADQERLAKHALSLAERGCKVIISNADHTSLRELYADFECLSINRPSVIAAASGFRRTISECIFTRG